GIHDFCIEVNGKAVGNIGFTPGTDVECFNAEVGYVIGEKYWNQGIVTDALQEAIYHYFTYTNTIRIFALVFEHNLPSMRVLEKAGFNKVGIMTKSIFKNGHFTNAHLFELLKNV
ncbi:MAG: GNAT family protein, partial [Phocaeicola vulgatus]|nr:GNAT family protein [Phocaeicola vulgatus]